MQTILNVANCNTITKTMFADEKKVIAHAISATYDMQGRILFYTYLKEYYKKSNEWKNRHVWVTGAR